MGVFFDVATSTTYCRAVPLVRRRSRGSFICASILALCKGRALAQTCQIQDLFLRSLADANGNAMPIDIYPVPKDSYNFWAIMDYSMAGFQVEASATPMSHCTAQLTGPPTLMVDAGSSVLAEVAVRDTLSSASMLYHINVSRLSGKEISLMTVEIEDATFVPAWNAGAHEYNAYLDVKQDLIRVNFQPLDNGQVIRLTSNPQVIRTVGAATTGTTAPGVVGARRLGMGAAAAQRVAAARAAAPGGGTTGLGPPIGEVQRSPATLMSSIDTGRNRFVELAVTSADGSAQNSYHFTVQRPNCPTEQRFFDGLAKTCTDVCNEGYFGNHATGRCTQCLQEHCLVCDSLGNSCSLCEDGYALGGSGCVAGAGAIAEIAGVGDAMQNYGSTHRVLVLAVSIVSLIVICAVLVCCARGGLGFGLGARKPRLLESDDDELSTLRDYYAE